MPRWKDFAAPLLDWLIPARCAFCTKNPAARGRSLCLGCRERLEPVREPWCPLCGEPWRFAATVSASGAAASHPCPRCLKSPPPFERVRSAFVYREPLKGAVSRLKFGGDLALLRPLEELFGDAFGDAVEPGAVIASVPPAPGKLKERGFDLAHRLARRLAAGSSAIRTDLLAPTGEGTGQAGLKYREREANARLRFRAAGARLEGTPVVYLVDDVCTTAATLRACAAILKSQGAGTVRGLTLARTVQE